MFMNENTYNDVDKYIFTTQISVNDFSGIKRLSFVLVLELIPIIEHYNFLLDMYNINND